MSLAVTCLRTWSAEEPALKYVGAHIIIMTIILSYHSGYKVKEIYQILI